MSDAIYTGLLIAALGGVGVASIALVIRLVKGRG